MMPISQETAKALYGALQAIVDAADHTRVFITSRERMHPTGVSLYDEDIVRARAAVLAAARETHDV